MRNILRPVPSNIPYANTPPRKVSPALASNRPAANNPPRTDLITSPPTSTTRSRPRESLLPVPTAIPRHTYTNTVLVEDVNDVEESTEEEEINPPAVPLLEQPLVCNG